MSARKPWPGALCEVVRSMAGNEGRHVVAVQVATNWIAHAYAHLGYGRSWTVIAVDPLMMNLGTGEIVPSQGSRCEFPEDWLRPITEPPEEDTDTTPIAEPEPIGSEVLTGA